MIIIDIVSIIIFLIFILLSAIIDVEGFKSGNFIDSHNSRFILRGVVILGMSMGNIILIPLFMSLWVLFFDYTINYLWGKDIFYIGKTAEYDKLLNKLGIGKYTLLGIKISLVIITSLMLICSY